MKTPPPCNVFVTVLLLLTHERHKLSSLKSANIVNDYLLVQNLKVEHNIISLLLGFSRRRESERERERKRERERERERERKRDRVN